MPRVSRHFQLATIGLAVLLCLQLAIRHGGSSTTERVVPALQPGDALPEGVFTNREKDGAATLLTFLQNNTVPCALLVYFRSDCPACQTLAPLWKDSASVNVQGLRLPVLWIGATRDQGATTFIGDYSLPGRTIDDSSWRDLGIPFVPFGHIAHRTGRLVTATSVNQEFLGRTPNPELSSITESCKN